MSALPQATWRLLSTPPAPGAWNMAVDEAILEAVGRGAAPATLRLYAWQPPCLSLGYAQPVEEVDRQALAAYGYDLVRRPTGGRAILHTDELTYAVIGQSDEPRLAGSVLESYRLISQALLAALHRLGIPAQAADAPSTDSTAQPKGPVCFEIPSNYEITCGGKKLVGSAQARRKEGVLQHGSLPLDGDLTRILQALVFPSEAARQAAAGRLLQRATTAGQILGAAPAWDTAAIAFAAAFAETLNLELTPGELSQSESERAAQLVVEKHANLGWILHRGS